MEPSSNNHSLDLAAYVCGGSGILKGELSYSQKTAESNRLVALGGSFLTNRVIVGLSFQKTIAGDSTVMCVSKVRKRLTVSGS